MSGNSNRSSRSPRRPSMKLSGLKCQHWRGTPFVNIGERNQRHTWAFARMI
jgi:hypothetical protein